MTTETLCPFTRGKQAGDEVYYTCEITEHRCPHEGSNPDCEVVNDELAYEQKLLIDYYEKLRNSYPG